MIDDPAARSAQPARAAVNTGSALLLVALLALIGSFVYGIRQPGATFVWGTNMISDLGDGSCRTWNERWVCSPGWLVFNMGCIVAGSATSTAAWTLRDGWGRRLAGGVAVLGLGLILLGVTPNNLNHPLHMMAAVVALPVPALGLLITGIRPRTHAEQRGRWPRVILTSGCLVLCAEHLVPGGEVIAYGHAEMMAVLLLLLALACDIAVLHAMVTATLPRSTGRDRAG